jgi:hypothetical protein
MSSTNECDKCHKTFSTKSGLNVHRKTSKSCGGEKKIAYNCEYCAKDFTTANNLQKHIIICPEKKIKNEREQILKEKQLEFEQIIRDKVEEFKNKESEYNLYIKNKELEFKNKEIEYNQTIREQIITISSLKTEVKNAKEYLEKQVKDLQDRLDRCMEKGTSGGNSGKTINNNNQIQINFFTQEHIDQKVREHFNLDHLIQGVKGVARFARDHIAKHENKQIYECTDSARQVFYFISSEGDKIRDFKGTKLMKVLQRPICDKSLKILKEAESGVERLKSIGRKRTTAEERDLQLYEFMIDRWIDVSVEISTLEANGFVMELTKQITI